jgi:uncharacterized protein
VLQINVSQLLKSPVGSTRNYEVNDIAEIADGESLIQGEVRLTRTDRGILVTGTLHTGIELTCSRCLNSFTYPVTLNIEEEYFPLTDVNTGAPVDLPDEPECFTINERNILDLGEAIRQYGLLAIPMKPLCREDCAGLCPTCGCNLNEGPCDCPPKSADPRWSELSTLTLANNRASSNEQKGMK